MAYKLNKSTKTHIAMRAVREKYFEKFHKAIVDFAEHAYNQFYVKYNNKLFENLPTEVLNVCKFNEIVYIPCISLENINVALEHRLNYIRTIELPNRIFTSNYDLSSSDLENKDKLNDLVNLIKEIKDFNNTLMSAMYSFKSGEKLIAALPWAEAYYPECDKTPTCNIIPSGDIEQANKLMAL